MKKKSCWLLVALMVIFIFSNSAASAGTFLNSGENQTVEFEITPEDLAFWDDETHDWKVNSGQYSILLGTSSRHISHILSFTKE